jgi:hypothetical protein
MNLDDKGTLTAIAVVMFLVLFLTFPIMINPAKKQIRLLDKKIKRKESELVELTKLKREYRAVQDAARKMEKKIARSAKNVTLPSLLENIANVTKLKSKMTGLKSHETIKSKKFKEEGVEISLKNITIDELMFFVYKLESLPYMIKVKGFKIKTTYAKEPKYIKLTLLVSLFTPN